MKTKPQPKTKQTVLQKMIAALPQEDVGPFRTPTPQHLFCRIKVNGHYEHWPLKSDHFVCWVERILFQRMREMPPKTLVKELLRQFEGCAKFDGPEIPVFLRVARVEGQTIIDLGDADWNAVRLSEDGWSVGPSPVRFKRPEGMEALPRPATGGKVQDLFPFLNLPDDQQKILCLTWMLSALNPTGACPILSVVGPQGAAKSTLTRLIRSLTDPSSVPLRTVSRNERNLVIAAQHSWILAFDNLSEIPSWLSDSLCRLSTGGGMGERGLYTDAKEILFSARRPVIFNGVGELAERGDLRDRLVDIHLPTISAEARQIESELERKFEAVRPKIFGALLDVLVAALRKLPSVQAEGLPRMTEFARLGIAAETALGFSKGAFLKSYQDNIRESNLQALEFSPAVRLIPTLLNGRSKWEGTHLELLRDLEPLLTKGEHKDPTWPRSAKKMSVLLARGKPALEVIGIRGTIAAPRWEW